MTSQKTIAIFIEDQYQDLEVWYPYLRLREAGFIVWLVAKEQKTYVGKYGYPAQPDKLISDLTVEDINAVIIPGGFAPDHMRKYPDIIDFVKQANDQNKTVASICHGAWILASANILRGKQATCYFAIADDIKNAGANYVDQEVVQDGNLITARKPDDLPAFCKTIIATLS